MKRFLLLCMATCFVLAGFAQTDTTGKKAPDQADTIKVGGMIIIKKGDRGDNDDYRVRIPRRSRTQENLTTNWWILDLGFSNFNDQTNYSSPEAQAFAPGSTEDWFKLRTGKSRNVNIWVFMQKLNVVAHVVNLKYGVGVELNNYHFEEDLIFQKKPTLISLSPTGFKKDKLAADYLTVPIMLNFNFTPRRHHGFGFSAGVSGGYLYSSRWKTKEGGDVNKTKGNFDLKRWKVSYVAELLLGPAKIYGSYALENMWDKGLDQTPYTVGFRFSNW